MIRHILPAIESNLPFHLDSLDLIFSTTGFQNTFFLGFPPIGIPRYLKGRPMCLLLRHLEKTRRSNSEMPTAPTVLLFILYLKRMCVFLFLTRRSHDEVCIIKISTKMCLKLFHVNNFSKQIKWQSCVQFFTQKWKEAINPVVYKRSCTTKIHIFNIAWKAFNVSSSLSVDRP